MATTWTFYNFIPQPILTFTIKINNLGPISIYNGYNFKKFTMTITTSMFILVADMNPNFEATTMTMNSVNLSNNISYNNSCMTFDITTGCS